MEQRLHKVYFLEAWHSVQIWDFRQETRLTQAALSFRTRLSPRRSRVFHGLHTLAAHGTQQDFRADHAAFAGVVADLAVVLAVQLFPGTVGGRRNSGLPRAALDLRYMKME